MLVGTRGVRPTRRTSPRRRVGCAANSPSWSPPRRRTSSSSGSAGKHTRAGQTVGVRGSAGGFWSVPAVGVAWRRRRTSAWH